MSGPDPDQLLASMEAALAQSRAKRHSGNSRTAIRAAGILFLVLGAAVAVIAMQYVASQMLEGRPSHAAEPSATEAAAK